MKLFLISSFAIISTIMLVTPSLAFAQDPFTIGNSGDPFAVGGGGGGNAPSGNNITLGIRSDTDWSGTYGDSTGSTTVDGHGNKDFIFSCSNTYSADFQKKGEGQGFLRLNIVQNESNPAFTNAMNNSTAVKISQIQTPPSNLSSVNYTTPLTIYTAKVQKQYPEDVPQVTNTRTTTAQFGTVSVSGSC